MSQALASEVTPFPPPNLILNPGEPSPAEVGCYDRDGLQSLALYREDCRLWREQALACEDAARKVLKVTPWYQSRLFWLVVGAGVGLSAGVAAYSF